MQIITGVQGIYASFLACLSSLGSLIKKEMCFAIRFLLVLGTLATTVGSLLLTAKIFIEINPFEGNWIVTAPLKLWLATMCSLLAMVPSIIIWLDVPDKISDIDEKIKKYYQ